jgi:hypothetical protein
MYSDLAAELEHWAVDAEEVMEADEWEKAAWKFRAESDRLEKLAEKRAEKEKELEHRRKG